MTAALAEYRYADAARVLYGFAWDEFCSFYVEMAKARLGDAASRPVAQRVLAHTLDTLLRLLHPMTPFVTEEVWQLLAVAAPERGIDRPQPAAREHHDRPLAGVRPRAAQRTDRVAVRPVSGSFAGGARYPRPAERAAKDNRSNSPSAATPRRPNCCGPWTPYFLSLAGAGRRAGFGPAVEPPALSANVALSGVEVFVDLANLIDIAAEIERKQQELAKLDGFIAAKRKKLENQSFLDRARPLWSRANAESLKDLEEQRAAVAGVIERLAAR